VRGERLRRATVDDRNQRTSDTLGHPKFRNDDAWESDLATPAMEITSRRGLHTCFDLGMAERTIAAAFPAAMETIHAGYWKISSRAAINVRLTQISSSSAQEPLRKISLNSVEKKGRCLTLAIAGAALSAVAAAAIFAQDAISPRIYRIGPLTLPKNFNERVFVGSPLTPNALKGRPWLSR
jgi:hypothetical protein